MSPEQSAATERTDGTAARVVRALAARGLTVATAESLTAGLVSARLADVPGASAVLAGGVVSYASSVKASVLGVPEDLLAARGSVDPEVARRMAEGARRVCGTDWGVSTTGVAGPEPHDGKPVGTVYAGLAGPAGTEVLDLALRGSRAEIREETVDRVLDGLLRRL